jgi:photosystem II stability/assembly factor-like uncharacterized protein
VELLGRSSSSTAGAPGPADTPWRSLFGISFADDKTGWVVGQNGAIARSTDGGATWTAQKVEISDDMGGTAPLETSLFGVAAISPTEAWAVGDLGVVLHTRDGETWEKLTFDATTYADDNVPERLLNAVVFTSPTNGYIAGEFATLLRTTDGGQTWVGQREITGAPADLYLFSLSSSAAGTAAAVGLAGSVLVSGGDGSVWESRSVDTTAAFRHRLNAEHGVMTIAGDLRVERRRRTWTDPAPEAFAGWPASPSRAGEAIVVGERGMSAFEDGERGSPR